jgi:hypothetical protein
MRSITTLGKTFIGIAALCMSSTTFAYIVDGSRINRPSLLSYAKNKLQNRGIIEQSPNGLAYLNVPESYIKELYRQIHLPGYELPTQAQISIINELEAKNITSLQELGQTIQFKPLGFYTIVVDDQEFFMLAIDAPELSAIRKKYGLSETIENHAFTVPIGVKKIEADNELG